MMQYKGYTGEFEFDREANIFHGNVVGIRGVVTFEGDSEEELEQTFRDSVDDYLEFCAELGREPEKPFSGKFTVRIPPDLHHKATQAAQAAGKSLNAWLSDLLGKTLTHV